jgi:hypothetical protein
VTIEEIAQNLMEKYGQITNSCEQEPYKCEICQDTGWVRVDMGNGYTGVKECACVKAKKAESLIRKSGLGQALEQQTFDAFVTETDVQKAIKAAALDYIEALEAAWNRGGPHGTPEGRRETGEDGAFLPGERNAYKLPWFYIGGNPGSGKTHICTAICGELLKKNKGVRYMQWITEARRLKAYINEPDFDRLMDEYTDCDVLYIDDLFKMRYMVGQPLIPTEADVKIAFTILNARYLQDKPTIISSEWDMIRDLLPADEGVFSRVYERCKEHTLLIPRDARNNYRLARVKGATV